MLLSDGAIIDGVRAGEILLTPFTTKQLGPNSYDLRLGNKLLVYDLDAVGGTLDVKKATPTIDILIPDEGYVLEPGKLYLGNTVERAGSSVYAPMVEGKSSIGRLGLDIHVSAGFGDAGFEGSWTLELRTIHPLRIYHSMRICQVYFFEMKYQPRKLYNGKYVNQPPEPVASKSYQDADK